MIDNQYALQKLLGRGGSSKVFLATDGTQKVAIKAIRKDKKFTMTAAKVMLAREHELLQKLFVHPNIINSLETCVEGVLDYQGQSEPILYNVLEYAQNGPLSKYIRYTGPLEEGICSKMMLQLCHAVNYMHSMGYAHLDVKLDNILLDECFNIKLADLGSSVHVEHSEGRTNRRRGTYLYMPPEVMDLQQNEEFNAYAADVYCIGITLYVMLLGEFPQPESPGCSETTDGSESEKDASYNTANTKFRWSELSQQVRQLIVSMTDKDPQKRPSMEEVLNSEWLTAPLDDNAMQMVYEEMYYRNRFIKAENSSLV